MSAGSLLSCSPSDLGSDPAPTTAPVPRAGGRLVYAIEADPNGLDPTKNAWDSAGILLANALYDPAVAFDADGTPRPYLAESLTPAPDYRSWTIGLRPGVRFSNGDPLDAASLLTFVSAIRESPITGPAAQMIEDVTIIDPLRVEVRLSRPWATLPALLTAQGGYVVSPKQLANPNGHSEPIGTGPFVLRRWQQDRRFELVRNPDYWRQGLPYLDAVDFVVVPEGANRIEMVQEGAADVTGVSAPWDLGYLDTALARRPGSLQVEEDTGDTEKTSILFNTTKPPLDDVRVRRAVGYATDVTALGVDRGWPPGEMAQGPITSTSPFFSPAVYPTHDLEKARALVAEYLRDPGVKGQPRTVKFTITAIEPFADVVNQLVRQWAEAGIEVNVSLIDVKKLVRLAVFGEFTAMFWRYFAAPDPDMFWHFFVKDTVVSSGISLNFARLHSDAITDAMNEGRSSPDVDVRRRAYARMQAAFAQQLPYLWLQRWNWRVLSNNRLHDAHNVTLPDGRRAMPLVAGTHRLTETWTER